MRLPLIVLTLAVLCGSAAAGWRPQTGGDPYIDQQWSAQLRRVPMLYEPPAGIDLRENGRRDRSRWRQATPKRPSHAIDPAYLPALVDYETAQSPGTIVIDPTTRYLYLVLGDGKAQRYGVGVGREGFGWSGTVHVGRKAEWPTWTPPAEMRKRQPYLPVSMPGGPENPLGARAMYLYSDKGDTLFRIHGSNEPWTIGHAVSSGCFRMRNEDVTELYEQVGVGAKVVVL